MANKIRTTKLGLKNDITFPESLNWKIDENSKIIKTELGLELSPITAKKRLDLYKRLDPFTNFWWGGNNAFSNYGAFIIADKRGDLKASVGPSFSNNYTKPQFESSAGQLQGITFNTFQIRFKIGLYWISDDHYRKFLKWFDPYKVDFLKFGYDQKWEYQVKLASISEGTKYILGQENNIYSYYIETDMTFDIVGENCAYGESYTLSTPEGKNILQMEDTNNNKVKSILDSSFIFTGTIENDNNNDNKEYSLKISYYEENNKILEEEVFKIKFNENNSDLIYIQYNSDTGLIYWGTSDNSYKLLTLQQLYNGERLVSTFNSKKIKIPGEQKASLDYSNIKFEYSSGLKDCKIEWRPRINVI